MKLAILPGDELGQNRLPTPWPSCLQLNYQLSCSLGSEHTDGWSLPSQNSILGFYRKPLSKCQTLPVFFGVTTLIFIVTSLSYLLWGMKHGRCCGGCQTYAILTVIPESWHVRVYSPPTCSPPCLLRGFSKSMTSPRAFSILVCF